MNENKKRLLDKLVNFIFSNNSKKWIFLFFIFGFLIRTIISFRIPFYADEMGYITHSIGFIESGKLQNHNQDAIWFFITNLFMKVLDYNVFGVRFFSVLCGSFLIILTYLIAKEIFNEKIAIISSFMMTISSFSILTSIGQMDLPMAFFGFLSMYFLIIFLKSNNKKYFFLTWISMGIAVMIKQIALLFIPAFILFSIYYNKKTYKSYRINQIFYAALIIIVMVTPVLTYNYLLYKDKGITDMQFSRFFNISTNQYESISHTLNPFSLKTLLISHAGGTPGLVQGLNFLYLFESILILILSFTGIILFLKYKNEFKWLLFLSVLIPFIFLSGSSLLPNHFVFLTIFTSILSSLSIFFIYTKMENKNYAKYFILFLLILIFITCLTKINHETKGFFGKNEIGKLIDTKEKLIDPNALVVVDSRIYRGRIAFSFWDRHYLETNYFPNVINQIDQFPGQLTSMKVYFVEAATDDSGWGSISSQPEFNKSTEQIVSFFNNNTKVIKEIKDLDGNIHFRIYEGFFNLKKSILSFADETHEFFFYPLAYTPKSKVFDIYNTYSLIDSILDKIAHLILYLEVIVAFLLFLILGYLFHKNS